jgi:hypothetical protein
MAEATNERGGREKDLKRRAAQPPDDPRAALEPDREVENYRDEYDFEKQDRPRPVIDHRS